MSMMSDKKNIIQSYASEDDPYRLSFELANVGKSITLPNGEIRINRKFCDMLGYAPEEVAGKRWQDLTHPEDLEFHQKIENRLLDGPADSIRLDKRYRRKDGSALWTDTHVVLHRDAKGKPLYFITTVIDISERRHLEEEARKCKVMSQAVIGQSLAHLVYLDRDFNFVMVNATYAATCGKTPQELLGRNHFECYPHEENEAIFRQVRDSGEAVSFKDKPFVFPDQPERGVTYWDWTLSPVKDENGSVQGLVFSLIETTERKQLEEKLEHKAREWEETFDATNDAIWILDKDYCIVRSNKKAARLFGCSVDDLIGRHCWEVVHKTKSPIAGCPHVESMRTLRRSKLELQDGPNCFEVTADPLLDETGRYAGVVHIISDITERKDIERQKETALQKLFEQEFQYHHLADAGLALIWSAGVDKLCTYFNEPWLKFTGRTFEQEKGNGWTEGVHPEDLDRCIKIYTEAFDRREPFDMEYRLRNAQGVYRWIRDLGTPNYSSRGDFLGYIGHCFDVTAQKTAAEEILKLNSELEQKVHERTLELQKSVRDLEELNRVFVGRELRMAELKARIEELEKSGGARR